VAFSGFELSVYLLHNTPINAATVCDDDHDDD
jgi:hypothetical protein